MSKSALPNAEDLMRELIDESHLSKWQIKRLVWRVKWEMWKYKKDKIKYEKSQKRNKD